jgi:hypothetical protein
MERDAANKCSICEQRLPGSRAVFELSPAAPVFRECAERCYAKFGGTPAARPAAPPAGQRAQDPLLRRQERDVRGSRNDRRSQALTRRSAQRGKRARC